MNRMTETEKRALTGDRAATLRVVSALRQYRAAVEALLDARWQGGTVDGATVASFRSEVERIEEDHGDE